jgi:hypothetical protein
MSHISSDKAPIIAEIIPKAQSTMPIIKADQPAPRLAPPTVRPAQEKHVFTPPYYPKAFHYSGASDRQTRPVTVFRPTKNAEEADPAAEQPEVNPPTATPSQDDQPAQTEPAAPSDNADIIKTNEHQPAFFGSAKRAPRSKPPQMILLYQAILTVALVGALLCLQLINPELYASVIAYIRENITP